MTDLPRLPARPAVPESVGMQFFNRWRANQDEEEGSEAFNEDGSRVTRHDIDARIDPAEQRHRDLEMHTAQVLESAQPEGEGVDAGSPLEPSASSRLRRVSFELGLVTGPAAAQDGPVIRKPNTVVESQNWRWLLQQEELRSLAELSAPSSVAPQTAAESNALRRQAAEDLDLSSVTREQLHLLSAEELGALDELAYGGDVLQTAFRLEQEANEAAELQRSTRSDFQLATLLQKLEEEEEEADREDERWEDADGFGDEDEDEETEEERQVKRAMELTAEELEEEDEWKQVERAMARAAEQDNEGLPSPGAGIGAGLFGARSDAGAGIGAGIGASIEAGIGALFGRDSRRNPAMPPTPPKAVAPTPPEQDVELDAARAIARQQTQARYM